MKRFLALFLCIMMVLSLAPAAAFATEDASAEEIVEATEPAPAEVPAKEEEVFNVEEAYQTYIALSAEEQEVFLANLTEEQRGELMAYIAALTPAEEPVAEEPSKETEEPKTEEPAAEPDAEDFDFSTITANLEGDPVASVSIDGGTATNYTTMADAAAAAVAGSVDGETIKPVTITLLANTSENTRYELRDSTGTSDEHAYNFTLDLNGKNYTYSGSSSGAFLPGKSAKITIKGSGTLDTGSKQLLSISSTSNTVIIEGGTLKTTNASLFYTGSSTGTAIPKIRISGGTINASNFTKFGSSKNNPEVTITGGTFSFDPTSYVDTNAYNVTQNTTAGTWTVTEKQVPDVASVTIGETTTGYKSMSQAVSAAVDAGTTPATIKLLEDVPVSERLSLRKNSSDTTEYNFTLDLNGKNFTYSGASGAFILGSKATLTIIGNGAFNTGSSELLYMGSKDITLNIQSGSYTTTATAMFNTGSNAKPAVNISGGTFDVANATKVASTSGHKAIITGGTFNVNPTNFGVDTTAYQVTLNEGWYTVSEKPIPDVVAVTVGETTTNYKSMKLAYAALAELPETATATVTLLENAVVTEQLRNNIPVTFNLNGKTISLQSEGTGTTNKRIFGVYAPLTITGTGVVDATDNAEHYIAFVGKNQTMTLSGGTYKTGKNSTSEYNFFSKGDGATVVFGEDGSKWFNATLKKDIPEGLYAIEVADAPDSSAPFTFTSTAYTLTYDVNGGEVASAPAEQTLSALANYTVYHKMRVATPFKSHDGENFYKFDCWNTQADGEGTDYEAGGDISLSQDTVLYAQWLPTEDMCAAIGDDDEDKYPTVGEAIFEAEAGDTVKLLKDVTETILVPESANVVLDLKGHKIEGAGTGSAITNNGTLKIVDSSDDKTGSISGTAQSYGGGIESNGMLTLESGTITGEAPTGGGGIYIKNGSTFVMNGGTVTGTSDKGSAIYINNSANDVTINGGKISGSIFKGAKANVEVFGGVFSELEEAYVACGYTKCANEDEATKTGYPWTVEDHNDESLMAVIEDNNGYSIDDGLQIVKDDEGNLVSTGKLKVYYTDGTTKGEEVPAKDIALTLTGVTADKDGNVAPAAAKTGSFKIVAKLTNDPLGAKKARSATYKGTIIPVQVVSFKLTEDAETEPVTELSAIVRDASAVKSAAELVEVTPYDIKDQAGNKVDAADVKFTYATSDAKVAAVNSKTGEVTIPKGASGKALVTYTVTNVDKTAIEVVLPVTVKDYSPRLPYSAITFDTQKNDAYVIPVVTSYGNTITGVQFGKVDKSGTFTPSEDFETELVGSNIIFSTEEVLKNGTTAGTLRIKTKLSAEAEEVTYDYAFKITVKNSAPSVTAKVTQKFNKFYAVPKAKVSFSVKGCKVNDVEIEENDLFGGYWDVNEFVVTRKAGQTATTGTITLFVSLDGYAFPVTKTVKLTDETKAPVLVLDHVSSTLNKTIGTTDTFTVSVKGSDDELELSNQSTSSAVADVEIIEGDNKITVTVKNDKGGTIPVLVHANNWAEEKYVKVTPTVKLTDKTPSTKLDAAKLTLNKAFEQSAEVQVSLDQTDVIKIAVDDKSGKLADKLVPTVDDSTVTFDTVAGAEGTPKGTYKFDIIAQYKVGEETYDAQKQTVTVTVTEVVPKVTVSKVTFNTNYLELGESAKLTAKVGTKGYFLTGLAVADTELGYSIYSDNSGFYLLGSEDAKTDIKSIALKATLEDFDGNTAVVDTSVPLAFTSKAPALTIKSTGKLDMITRDPNYIWSETGVFYTITKISNVNAMVYIAELQGEDAELLDIFYTGSSYRVTLKDEAVVAAKDKLNFSLKITLADTCSGEKILTDCTYNTVLTVNESKLKVKTEGVTTALYQSADKYELEYIINPSSPAAAKIEKIELNNDKIDARLRSVIDLKTSEYGEGMDCEFTISECYFAAGKTYTIPVKVYAKGAVTPTLVDLKFTVAK